MAIWKCQVCPGSYLLLRDLVSHVRASHSSDSNLGYICGIQGCPRSFKRTNTWYKHVVECHEEDYQNKDPVNESEEDMLEEQDVPPVNNDEEYQDEANLVIPSEDDIAGKLLMLKEHHGLSQAAVESVVELVEMVSNYTSTRALATCGEELDMDTSSPFFQQLSELFEEFDSPLASIETAFRQQSYICANLPYVVCVLSRCSASNCFYSFSNLFGMK